MTVNRRQFFRRLVAKQDPPLRPPWSSPEPEFVATCSRCSSCIDKCPEKIIERGSGGFPEINFHIGNGGCSFCHKCVEHCETSALSSEAQQLPWDLVASIATSCISMAGVTCRSCGDACDQQAILFKIEPKGVATPIIDPSRCTGCGYCLKPCPVDAVKFEAKRLELAQHVWDNMKATDSRECRNCHDYDSMDYMEQGRRAVKQHIDGFEKGQTCIDCHKGIAHSLPEMAETP